MNLSKPGSWTIGLIFAAVAVIQIAVPAQVPTSSPSPSVEQSPKTEILDDVDPTKPILFSVRNEYRDLRNGGWINTVLFRYDRFALRNLKIKGGGKGLVLRFDVPLNSVHQGSGTEWGLGDIYGQVLFVPYATRRFAFSAGSGISVPTATNEMIGQGKLVISPLAVPLWYLANRKRLITVRFQQYISVGGKAQRTNVNYVVVNPTFAWAQSRKTWLLLDTEFKHDWRTGLDSAISGVQIGHMMTGKSGFWIKPEIPWGAGRQGGFNIKVGLFRFR